MYYFLLTIVVVTAAELDIQQLLWITKPLLLISLLLYFSRFTEKGSSVLVKMALGASLIGDVLLMFDDQYPQLFLLGLLAFLTAHVCYTAFFIRDIFLARPWKQHWSQLAMSTVLVVYAVEFYILNREAFGSLWLPTLLYICVIAAMGIAATMRDRDRPGKAYGITVAGAVLFIVSDSLLALNKFVMPFPFADALVLGFYAAAQLLLVSGIILILKNDTVGTEPVTH
jgi:uncharacterized membrane protein YhhN